MAQYTSRIPQIFLGGSYWRADISWRELTTDPDHFATEWTGSIPNPPVHAFVAWHFQPLIVNAMEGGIYVVDEVQFEFGFVSSVANALNPGNASAAIRLWWSGDGGTTWEPVFWGDIDLDEARPETTAVVQGLPWVRYRFAARDSLIRLTDVPFSDKSRVAHSSYIATSSPMLGDLDINNVREYFQSQGNPLSSIRPSSEIISVKYYLEQCARICFDERYTRSVSASLAYYGYGATPIDGPFRWWAASGGSYPNPSTPATVVEKTWADLHFLWNLFSSNTHVNIPEREDWSGEFGTWGDCLVGIMAFLGFAVTTRHIIEGGRWVRALQYVDIAGDNGLDIQPEGVLMQHSGPVMRRAGRRMVITTRLMQKSWNANEESSGEGPEKKLTIWWRSIGGYGQNQSIANMTGENKANVLWQVPLILDGSTYRFVQGMRVGSTYYPYANPANAYPAWATNFLGTNGLAKALAAWYGGVLYRKGARVLHSVHSRLTADDGSTVSPRHYRPFARLADDVLLGRTFRLTRAELDAASGNVTIDKEEV